MVSQVTLLHFWQRVGNSGCFCSGWRPDFRVLWYNREDRLFFSTPWLWGNLSPMSEELQRWPCFNGYVWINIWYSKSREPPKISDIKLKFKDTYSHALNITSLQGTPGLTNCHRRTWAPSTFGWSCSVTLCRVWLCPGFENHIRPENAEVWLWGTSAFTLWTKHSVLRKGNFCLRDFLINHPLWAFQPYACTPLSQGRSQPWYSVRRNRHGYF